MSAKRIVEATYSFLPPPPESKGVHMRKGASGFYAVYRDATWRSARLGDKIYFDSEDALRRALIRSGYLILPEEAEG